MRFLFSTCAQFRACGPSIGLILGVSTTLIGAVLFLHAWKGIPISVLTADPLAVSGRPIYTGFISQIGIFFWSASAAICIFSAKILLRSTANRKIRQFLILSGLLTLVLGFDDIFLLHEVFFPRFGIPEEAVLLSYAGLILFYIIRFHSMILETDYVLLGMAFGFFGLSIALDVLNPPGIDPFLFEDGLKLVGIVSWLTYFFRTAMALVDPNTGHRAVEDRDFAVLHRK